MLTPTETVVSPTRCLLEVGLTADALTQAMEWVFFVLAFVFLVARFWVRFSLRQYQAWPSDVLLVIALVCTIGNIMCDTLIYKVDGLLEYKHVTQYLGKVSDGCPSGMASCRSLPRRWTWADHAGRFGSRPNSSSTPGCTSQSSACS